LVAERMELKEEFFPADCDAVVYGLTDENRPPRLIVNRRRPTTRRRFTLAHELGHFLISWHLGTIVCHTDLRETEDDATADLTVHRTIEREANGFASELLMPQSWLRGLLTTQPVAEGIAAIQAALVSPAAACFAAINVLPPGHLLVLLDDTSRARYLFRTAGTDIPDHHRNAVIDPPSLDVMAAESARIPFANQLIYWWRFEQRAELLRSDDSRGASEVLEDILDDVAAGSERARLRARVNGIVGSAKSRASDLSPQGIHAELQQRFARADLGSLQGHREFRIFLSRKASEISENI
jgi:IrrE N-terminal-like domain